MDISHLAVLHNRLAELPALLRAALGQADDYTHEVLLVDNASTDGSGQWLAEMAQSEPRLRILYFPDYAPPSVRLNQAAEAAQGLWLHLMDPPAIPPANLCAVLLPLLTQHFADGAQGVYKPADNEASSIESHPHVTVWDRALEGMLAGPAPHTLLCRRELFLRAGGADTSRQTPGTLLPLRLAAQAQRWLHVNAPLALGPRRVPTPAERTGEYGEAFAAYHTALREFPNLNDAQRRGLYRRAMSAAWKEQRRNYTDRPMGFFWHYMLSTWPAAKPNPKALAQAAALFNPRKRSDAPLV